MKRQLQKSVSCRGCGDGEIGCVADVIRDDIDREDQSAVVDGWNITVGQQVCP